MSWLVSLLNKSNTSISILYEMKKRKGGKRKNENHLKINNNLYLSACIINHMIS